MSFKTLEDIMPKTCVCGISQNLCKYTIANNQERPGTLLLHNACLAACLTGIPVLVKQVLANGENEE